MKVERNRDAKFFSTQTMREEISKLVNSPITITVKNRGKSSSYDGKITAEYSSVFLFEHTVKGNVIKKSYAYSDIYTGDIKIEGLSENIV